MADSPATIQPAPFIALPGGTGRYVDTPNIAAYDLEADWEFIALAAADDWTPAGDMTLLGLQEVGGDRGVRVFLDTTGKIGVQHGDDTTQREVLCDVPAWGLLNGTTHHIRIQWHDSDGFIHCIIDGTQTDLPSVPNTNTGVGSGEDLHIGANPGGTTGIWVGSIYYAELRDDAGVVIARMDARQALAAV